jgi:hypothetical protein
MTNDLRFGPIGVARRGLLANSRQIPATINAANMLPTHTSHASTGVTIASACHQVTR